MMNCDPSTELESVQTSIHILTDRMAEMIGRATAKAIFRSAAQRAARRHELLHHVDTSNDPFDVLQLIKTQNGTASNPNVIAQSLHAWIQEVNQLLEDLTGNILIFRLKVYFDEVYKQLRVLDEEL